MILHLQDLVVPTLSHYGHNYAMALRTDETWHRLLGWTAGQAPSERLAAQLLLSDGFVGLDPSHPLGGRDGGRDAVARRDGLLWVIACYFPRDQKSFSDVRRKFVSDHAGVATHDAGGFAFVTNQELTVSQREQLREYSEEPIEIYHLERLVALLDQPRMKSIRLQYLGIDFDEESAHLAVSVRSIGSYGGQRIPLVGRGDEIEAARSSILSFIESDDRAAANGLVITGMPGIGKTTLAMTVASSCIHDGLFPGGAVIANFRGYDPRSTTRVIASDVLATVMLALGTRVAESDPSRLLVEFQTFMNSATEAGQRILLLLDNVSSVQQISEIIDRAAGNFFIVTSRDALGPEIGSQFQIKLAPLSTNQAAGLIVSSESISASQADGVGIQNLVRHCGGLPLALRLVANVLAADDGLTAESLSAELDDEARKMEGLQFNDSSLEAVFAGSYLRLSENEQRVFRMLSLLPTVEFSTQSAAQLLDTDNKSIGRVLRRLGNCSLLDRGDNSDWWRMHDLLRLYGARQLSILEAEPEAQLRLFDYYFQNLENANYLLKGDGDAGSGSFTNTVDAMSWLALELPNIVASIEIAREIGEYRHVWRMGIAAYVGLTLRGEWATALSVSKAAVDAAIALDDSDKEAAALNNQGLVLNSMNRTSEAKAIFKQGRLIYRSLDDRSGEAQMLVGLSEAIRSEGSSEVTFGMLRRAVKLHMDAKDARGAGSALTNLGIAYREAGALADAIPVLRTALSIHESTGAQHAVASTITHLGTALSQMGQHVDAVPLLLRAIEIATDIGDRRGLAAATLNLGNVYLTVGRSADAERCYLGALDAARASKNTELQRIVLINMIRLYRGAGDSARAEVAHRELHELNPVPQHGEF